MSESKSILPSAEDIFDSSGLKLWFPSNKQKQLVLNIIKHTVEITKEKSLEIAADEAKLIASLTEKHKKLALESVKDDQFSLTDQQVEDYHKAAMSELYDLLAPKWVDLEEQLENLCDSYIDLIIDSSLRDKNLLEEDKLRNIQVIKSKLFPPKEKP